MAKAPRRSKKQPEADPAVPGPSRNAATNLLLADIALRTGFRLGRRYLERGLLARHFTSDQAKRIVKGRPLSKSIGAIIVTRIATRSIPGAMLVGGGLLAKVMFDRRKSARTAKAEGEEKLAKQADKAT